MLSKLKSTYIDVLPTLKGPDGRIHTSFLQTGTATGRLSSRNPNLQNIPVRTDEGRLIRSAFTPGPGNIFISADYSQIELVVLAHMAGDFINLYFERYSGIRSFVDRTVRSAEELGYVETLFHHRRTIQGINSRNKTEKNAAERVAVNTVIQGSASEIMKRAMIALGEHERSYLVLQVHDELIFECPISEAEDVKKSVKYVMENTTKLSVPVRASVESGSCWGDMH